LLQLPEVVQHAFILSKLDGLSYPDVAEALGISSKSAQRYVLKAWQHLIQHLGHDFLGDNLTR
jgi:RNA polymerase sigma-70 factor (ECF subfamily)